MKISVVGAVGTVGSCTAYTLAIQGLAGELVLLDAKQNILLNHCMDIKAAVVGRQDVLIRAGNYADMQDSDIVVVSAGVHFPGSTPLKDKLDANIPIMREIAVNVKKFCPQAILIIATNPVDLMNYAAYLSSSLDRKQFIGYNFNDTLRLRMATADVLNIKYSRVEGIVAGYHPAAPVFLFSSIKVDGKPYFLKEETKVKLKEELGNYLKSFEALKAGRTAGWTSAAGISIIVRAIKDDSKAILPCSAVLDGEYGQRQLSMGVPAIIGKRVLARYLSGTCRRASAGKWTGSLACLRLIAI